MYYRVGKTVFWKGPRRTIPVVTCEDTVKAALTVRALQRTDGGRTGEWRKFTPGYLALVLGKRK